MKEMLRKIWSAFANLKSWHIHILIILIFKYYKNNEMDNTYREAIKPI